MNSNFQHNNDRLISQSPEIVDETTAKLIEGLENNQGSCVLDFP